MRNVVDDYGEEGLGRGIYAAQPASHAPMPDPHGDLASSYLDTLLHVLRDAAQQGFAVEITERRSWWRRLFGIGGKRIRLGGSELVRIQVSRP